MDKKLNLLKCAMLYFATGVLGMAENNTTMWYDRAADEYGVDSPLKAWINESQNPKHKPNPDQAWEKYALPLGNGFMGAMMYGGVSLERIQLNDASIWHGGPGSKGWKQDLNKADAHQYMDAIRKALLSGDTKKAQLLSTEHLRGLGPDDRIEQQITFGRYQTFGELYIKSPHKDISNYKRKLDLSTGVHSIYYRCAGANYTRSAFCSYPDRCLVLNYAGERIQDLSVELASPHPLQFSEENGVYVFAGKLENNGLQLDCRIKIIAKNGKVESTGEAIHIKGSSDTTVIITLNTNYEAKPPIWRGSDAADRSVSQLGKAGELGYLALKKRHVKDHHELHGRVAIDLGSTAPEVLDLPTDVRVMKQKYKPDHDLEELYFQFGRYLLIASSREGSLPANLQGLWCNERMPAWRSDYHLNINLQMNYWPSGPCNLIECQRPLIDFTETLSQTGKVTAKSYFNARGWTANLTSNIWGYTAPNPGRDRPRYWAYFPMTGAWLTTHCWEQYAFEGDEAYLRDKCWPIMQGTADFLVDSLYKLPDGTMSSIPSWSPEHGPISIGTTCDIAMAREALKGALATAHILGVKGARVDSWKKALDTLVPYKIGKHGQLQEWYEDIDNPKDVHRHLNHLFGLYPGSQISIHRTPKLANAAKTTLMQRGDGATGWSMGWKLNFWARMHDGDHAYILMRNLFRHGTNPNLLDVHPPFQIDGNFGGCAGIAEMLLQSEYLTDGANISLLPALPKEWHTGSFKGLRARSGVTVDLKWSSGKVTSGSITSDKDNNISLHYDGKVKQFNLEKGKTVNF